MDLVVFAIGHVDLPHTVPPILPWLKVKAEPLFRKKTIGDRALEEIWCFMRIEGLLLSGGVSLQA